MPEAILYACELAGRPSVEDQLSVLRGWALTNELEIRAEFDENYRKRPGARHELFGAIKLVRPGDWLCVCSEDYLASTRLFLAWVRSTVAEQGGRFYVADEQNLSAAAMEGLVGDVLSWEKKLRGTRKATKEEYLNQPSFGADLAKPWLFTPFGWQRVEGSRRLEPVPREQDIVREIMMMRDVDRLTWYEIAKTLKQRQMYSRAGTPLPIRSIQRIYERVVKHQPVVES